MKTIIQALVHAMRCRTGTWQLWGVSFLLAASMSLSYAQNVPVALNLPTSVSGDIVPGMTALDLPFVVQGADGLALDVIVPVNGARMSLIDPTGAAVLVPNDSRLTYHPGSQLTPPLPGGVFTLAELPAPSNGTWILRLTFPAAHNRTVAMATVRARSRYQVGIAIERTTLLAGEDVAIGMIVLDNGTPIRGLLSSISVGQGTPGQAIAAHDNGQQPDGLADDGVYTIDYTFATAGTYDILGSVEIQTPEGPIQRTAVSQVRVINPPLSAGSSAFNVVRSAGNCVSGLQVLQNFNVLEAATYATLIRLRAPNGKTMDIRKSRLLPLGAASVTALFDAKTIRQTLASDGPYSVALIESLRVGASELTLGFRKRDAGIFNVTLEDLCTEPIVLQQQLTMTPVIEQGYIASFDVAFPIQVSSPGFYQISFKVVGQHGEDIALFNASRSLAAGVNTVVVNIRSEKFLAVDGPYRAISLVVVGGGNSARLTSIGTSDTYSRWQFLPSKNGDLNSDGSVDGADMALVTQYRGLRAAIPGDRRDINRDGIIDIRDARALQTLR